MTDRRSPLSTDATRFARIRTALERYEPATQAGRWAWEFLIFGFKQGWACLFGGLMLALLIGTHLWYPADAPLCRYDFLSLGAIAIQAGMLLFRLETLAEARVILAFHVVGTVMELFKTAHGSWLYPEPSVLRIADVPLFSGFMYAAVGSYLARVWRIFDFSFTRYPPRRWSYALAIAIYVNFFAHHWLPDIRIGLFAVTALLFARTSVGFVVLRERRSMPLLLGWLLVAIFIWFAENIGTFSQAWLYPDQRGGWAIVSPAKLGSWYLLMIVSFVLVAALHHRSERATEN